MSYEESKKTILEEKLFVNKFEFTDKTVLDYSDDYGLDAQPEDNIRVFVPLDLSRSAIIRRLKDVFYRYGDVNETNETAISREVEIIISQTRIYNQFWFSKEGDSGNGHSEKATKIVKEILIILRNNEGTGEVFPYELIDELKQEYKVLDVL